MSNINTPDAAGSPQPPTRDAGPFPQSLTVRRIRLAWVAAIVALACIPFAVSIHHAVYHFLHHLPIKGFYAAATQFPSATIVTLVLASVALLDRRRAHFIAYFLVAIALSSAVNDSLKYLTGRARPRYSVLLGHTERKWIKNYREEHPGTRIREGTADQWIGVGSDNPVFFDGYSSFPSGHSNSSFVLAAFLSAMYPEGRILWCLAAAGTGVARVEGQRHWPEDVMFGGALGWIIAQLVFSWRWPLRLGLWAVSRMRRPASNKKPGPRPDGAGAGVECSIL